MTVQYIVLYPFSAFQSIKMHLYDLIPVGIHRDFTIQGSPEPSRSICYRASACELPVELDLNIIVLQSDYTLVDQPGYRYRIVKYRPGESGEIIIDALITFNSIAEE